MQSVKDFFKQSPKEVIEDLIFYSKWLLIPFFLKLAWALLVLMYYFVISSEVDHHHIMYALEAVDVVMVACLVKMVITGSYHSFVDKNHNKDSESVSSGILKVKLTTSIVGVASVHLLKSMISDTTLCSESVNNQLMIYGALVGGSLVLAIIDALHCKYTH